MDYLKNLEIGRFVIVRRETTKKIPAEILKRYQKIPSDYLTFLQQFEQITNREDTAWFNSIEDFQGKSDSDFAWNEFEVQSLEAFHDDSEQIEYICAFWDNHFPIALSVKGEYHYLAICLESERCGEIVYGVEPEFEKPEKVCDDFNQLMTELERPMDNNYLRYFA